MSQRFAVPRVVKKNNAALSAQPHVHHLPPLTSLNGYKAQIDLVPFYPKTLTMFNHSTGAPYVDHLPLLSSQLATI